MQTVAKQRMTVKEGRKRKEGVREGDCQTAFSQAGLWSHLLSSFKGVVMVTVVGTQMWLRG